MQLNNTDNRAVKPNTVYFIPNYWDLVTSIIRWLHPVQQLTPLLMEAKGALGLNSLFDFLYKGFFLCLIWHVLDTPQWDTVYFGLQKYNCF